MENIKFRVWDNVDYMSKPFTLLDVQRRLTQFTHDCTVMSFTGFTDIKGVEIYEGDLIEKDDDKFVRCGVVSFIRGCWMVASKSGERYFNLHWYLSQAEVIGNIHQHPELLEGDK